MLENLAQEELGAVVLGIVEEFVRDVLLDDLTLVHEHHLVSNGGGSGNKFEN